MAYELIETVEVGSGGASSIEFTSIPQDGTDLMLKVSARTIDGDSIGTTLSYLRFNDSTTDYSAIRLFGNGSSINQGDQTYLSQGSNPSIRTANTFSNSEAYISNYTTASSKPVSTNWVNENNDTAVQTRIEAGLWDNTASITKVSLVHPVSFAEHSTAFLYKITAA